MAGSWQTSPRRLNGRYVNGPVANVTDRLVPSALREVRTDLTKRPVLIGMLALGLILGISGPFNTINLIPALPRTLYWITVVFVTFAIGSLIDTILRRLLTGRPTALVTILSACGIGLAVTATLALLNLLAFGFWYGSWMDFVTQLGVVTMISAVVVVCSVLLSSAPTDTPAALLNRLPLDKRGALVSLSAEDHYVRVTTTKGEEMVLIRLSDAVAEVGSTEGLQIHRSHWIALDQIEKITRKGDRGEVTLSNQTTRPISRSYMPTVREAGLLPKGRGGSRSLH